MSKYKDYVCIRPFAEAQIMTNGDVLGCCPAWVNHFKLGNLKEKSLKDIWNDKPAQEFRESILDGSFRFCNEKSCPVLQSKHGEVLHRSKLNENIWYPEVIDDINNEKTILDHGPLHYQMAYDRSCNLSCPSCRSELIYAKGNERVNIEHFQTEIMANIRTARRLTVTPSGDPFASITFRNFLINLKQEDAPNLTGITILTNGILLKKYWNELSEFVRSKIDCISVSVDSTTEDVYGKIRRGGDFKSLIENLEFIRDKIKLNVFAISTVIQKDNYEQLSEFITFARRFNCNRLQYQIFEPDFRIWEDISYIEEWKDKAVQENTHALHQDFLKYVNDIKLDHSDLFIDFGPLLNLKNGMDISQLETVEQEYRKYWDVNIKKIWYDNQIHEVKINHIKKVLVKERETDAVYLVKLKTYVYWDDDVGEWTDMNKINIMKVKDISETIEFIKQGNLKKFDYNDLVNVIPTFGLNDEILHEQPISLQSFYGKGIKIWQYPNQFARLIMWLNDIHVNSYVEIGCRWGGTFIIISQILKLNNDNIKLYACDLIDQSEILREYSQHVNFNYLQINSRCEEFINSVRNNCDMVFIDGDHTYEGCKYDFDLFKDNINTKYIIFHDIDSVSCPGVSKLWDEIKVDDRFEFIEFIEQYPIDLIPAKNKYLGIGILIRK